MWRQCLIKLEWRQCLIKITYYQSNGSIGKARVETVPDKDYILLPLWTQDPPFSFSSKDSPGAGYKPSEEEEKKDTKDPGNEDSKAPITKEPRVNKDKDNVNSTNRFNGVSSTVNVASNEVNFIGRKSSIKLPDDPNMHELENISIFEDLNEDVFGVDADLNNLESTIQEMCTEFEKMMHKKFQMSSIGELTFFLGLQVKQKEDMIFISQDKYVNEILNKFGYSNVKTASTPMETHKNFPKDEKGEDVDEDPKQEIECKYQEKEDNVYNTNNVNAASTNGVNAVSENTNNKLSFDLEMPTLEDISILKFSSDHEDDDEEADMNNTNTTIQVSPVATTRIYKDYPLDQLIDDICIQLFKQGNCQRI
nr:copia protein [Tanacetum cinerariifolium]